MTNLQRVGGKVEVAKEHYFNANTWMNGVSEKEKLDAFCEWCDRECEVAYYEVYFDKNHNNGFKFKSFSDVIYILYSVTKDRDLYKESGLYNEIRSYLNDHTHYHYCWCDDFGDEHSIDIVDVFE